MPLFLLSKQYGTTMFFENCLEDAPQLASAPADGQVGEFAVAGENDFRQGNYQSAVRDLKHAMLDDPNNGTLLLLMSQALFATGSYDEAAGAVQQAMQMLPEDQWGVVVSNFRELYPKVGNYTDQLRGLEKQVKEKPDSPALRFLAGYHYGYLGYPTDAFKQLEKAKALAPQDEMAKKLLEVMAARVAGGTDGAKPAAKQPRGSTATCYAGSPCSPTARPAPASATPKHWPSKARALPKLESPPPASAWAPTSTASMPSAP